MGCREPRDEPTHTFPKSDPLRKYKIPRWIFFTLHRGTGKFFRSSIPFLRSFISFLRSSIPFFRRNRSFPASYWEIPREKSILISRR